jgi:hypothetical protein
VNKLDSRISKHTEKNSSRLVNFVSLGQQHQKGRKGPSSLITFWGVCGAIAWRNAKNTMLVSEARHSDNSKIVTTSDKVFGLLLIDNYLEKWKTLAAAGTGLVDKDNPAEGDKAEHGQKRRQTTIYVVL